MNTEIDDLAAIETLHRAGADTLYVPVAGLGDGIAFSAVAKVLFHQNGGKKIFLSHKNTEVFQNNPYVETLDGFADGSWTPRREAFFKERGIRVVYPTYWKFFFNENGRLSFGFPMKKHLIQAVAEKAGCRGNVELKPEIFLTNEEKRHGRFFEKTQIAIMSTANDIYKQWNRWQELVDALCDKFSFVQIGAPKDIPLKNVLDMRGKLSLRECAATLYNSDLFVGQIGGLMHMARAVNCPAVIAYAGAGPIEFATYCCNKNVFPCDPCQLCSENKLNPSISECVFERKCIRSVSVKEMISAVEEMMRARIRLDENDERKLSADTAFLPPPHLSAQEQGLFEYFLRNGSGVFVNGSSCIEIKRKRILGLSFFKIKEFSSMKSAKETFLLRLWRRHVYNRTNWIQTNKFRMRKS